MQNCPAHSSTAAWLTQINSAAQRAAALTRQLLAFSRKQVIQTRNLALNPVLQNLDGILSRLLGEDIVLTTVFAADLPAIEADPNMIEQVVMNLAVNARDAMPKGGQLRVATSVIDVDAAHALNQVGAREGRFICLEITDSGCGMSPETLGRIFEPFFTTKEVGKGTGLGLATVYGIVKQHQGWLEVSSKVGVGTTFKVFLPASGRAEDGAGEHPPSLQNVRGGRETILLVEDEPTLRELVQTILRSYQYNVLSAANGVDALELWDKNRGRIDLLLTDLLMPAGMNGHELAAKLRQYEPRLKVIYTSGYSQTMLETDPNHCDGLFLAKPYRPLMLAQLVRACLDGAVCAGTSP
jgi:CheY-like chemotaxis protein